MKRVEPGRRRVVKVAVLASVLLGGALARESLGGVPAGRQNQPSKQGGPLGQGGPLRRGEPSKQIKPPRQAAEEGQAEKLVVTVPAGAEIIAQSTNKLELRIAVGRARPTAETWGKEWTAAGWREIAANFSTQGGGAAFRKDTHSLTILYSGAGDGTADVAILAIGVELEIKK